MRSMWIGVLWAGLRVAMWINHMGGKFRHGLLEKVTDSETFQKPSGVRGSVAGNELGNDKRPESRGFKKSAEIGHGSSAPL